MTQLTEWLNSGLYVFVALSEKGYQENELAKKSWPDAAIYGDYRLVNFRKDSAQYFLDHLAGIGLDPNFGIGDKTPMLLTWDEAMQFASQFSVEMEEDPTTP